MKKYLIALAPLGITLILIVVAGAAYALFGEGSRAFRHLGALAGGWLIGGPVLTFIFLSAVLIHDAFKKVD